MLMYHQGRFWTEGASFAVPDGFFLETDPVVTYKKGITAWNPTQSVLYRWTVYKEQGGTRESLEKAVCEFQPLTEIIPVSLNGLSGQWLIYGINQEEYYEARFALSGKSQLVFMVEEAGGKLQKVMDSPEFRSALENIRAEQTKP